MALVTLAEPGNLYKAFQDTFTATSVATQAKYLEQKLKLPVRCLRHPHRVCHLLGISRAACFAEHFWPPWTHE